MSEVWLSSYRNCVELRPHGERGRNRLGGREEGTREEREGGSERLWNYLETEAQPP